jgi:hypothetical protein
MSLVEFDRQSWRHPPGCDCGCQDDCGPNLNNVVGCWREIEQLRHIVRSLIDEVGGPIKTGPIRGVVHGKAAHQGNVGEVLTGQTTGTFTAAMQTQTVSPLVIPPGDFDVTVSCDFEVPTTSTHGILGAEFTLAPQPPNTAISTAFYSVSGSFERTLEAPVTQVNVSVPTLLAFTLKTNDTKFSTATADAGTFTFNVYARRMR